MGRSRASRRTKARGLGQRRPRTAGFGEALHDLFPVPGGGVPENDPTVEIDPFERTCRTALCPPRIGQVLLRRVRDAACHEKEGDPARADDDRFQRRRNWPRWSSMVLLDDLVRQFEQPHGHLGGGWLTGV